ncbi:MAG: hypothetical protein QOG21_2090 [Actinomycetota bacterium]|nr:hypothetical protein [Actinomycetota bacterium]
MRPPDLAVVPTGAGERDGVRLVDSEVAKSATTVRNLVALSWPLLISIDT